MEQRRVLLFFVSSMAVLIVWMNFIAPRFFPPPPRDAKGDDPAAQAGKDPEQPADPGAPLVAPKPGEAPAAPEPPLVVEAEIPEPEDAEPVPPRTILLGSLDPETGYFLAVEITNRGAGIASITLNDPRFPSVDDPQRQLRIIDELPGFPPTLASAFALEAEDIKQFVKPGRLNYWKIATQLVDGAEVERIVTDPKHPDVNNSVTLATSIPELGIGIEKTYRLKRSEQLHELAQNRKVFAGGYEVELEWTITNLTGKLRPFVHCLQGPTGIPFEDKDNTRIYRSIKIGYPDETGQVDLQSLGVAALKKIVDENKNERFNTAFRFIGVDVQYFAALIVPGRNQREDQTFADALPMLLSNEKDPNHNDLSVMLQSRQFELLPRGQKLEDGNPGDVYTESLVLFTGPKREDLVARYDATAILDYGTFGALAGWMLLILNFLNDRGLPYGIAIIILTMIVRMVMFPLSRKQAMGAKKMQELKPELDKIKKKFAKDKEKLARAQMELFRKHKYNPLAGCLPMFVQLPIFISLYTALNTSVDLRMTPFLWFDNLAAPDALFKLPVALPFLGNQFNLLPILTIILFVVQQKMFMPPATDPETRAQYKMMNFLMIFMGFLFYKVPSGLCTYFIASSLWGIGERKMLDIVKQRDTAKPQSAPTTETARK